MLTNKLLISNYFYTIIHLKPKQIYRRIWFHLTKRRSIDESTVPNLKFLKNKFCLPVQKKISLLSEDTFYFLNKSASLSKISWNGNDNAISKLWRYNQHYFDDLNATESLKRKKWHESLLNRWVNENKVGIGLGWDPYPTSLRIVNWIKWYFLGNVLSKKCIKSLAIQARWLSKRIEWHILGNHLFSNAKALVFAGLFFSSKESENWLKKGLEIIEDEIDEQILDDGGHFERSPMYHAIFLEDILDLINISRVYQGDIKKLQVNKWIKTTNKMFEWLETVVHPDGENSFFNDTAIGNTPNLNELKRYAQRLNINYNFTKHKKIKCLQNSGYIRVTSKESVAIIDVAPIGPDYLPAHSHADTLSFELSLFGQRLLVNSGISEYKTSPVRRYERSTEAHNTVVVNNLNSSEVWKGFRVARRAYPFDLKIEELKNCLNISCAHDGYKRLFGKPIHRRSWKFLKRSLIINDNIEGPFQSAFAYFHFHPSVVIIKKKNILKIRMSNNRKVIFKIKTGASVIRKSYYSPEFGKTYVTKCLKIALNNNNGSYVQISW